MNKSTNKNRLFQVAEIEIISLENNDIIVTSEKPFPGEWDEFTTNWRDYKFEE